MDSAVAFFPFGIGDSAGFLASLSTTTSIPFQLFFHHAVELRLEPVESTAYENYGPTRAARVLRSDQPWMLTSVEWVYEGVNRFTAASPGHGLFDFHVFFVQAELLDPLQQSFFATWKVSCQIGIQLCSL